jgi:hypothetical protein
MRTLVLSLVLVSLAAAPSRADDPTSCSARGVALSQQAETFTGEARMKRLIDADLKRARKELAEGDEDECIEALDHAAKLLAGGA